MLFAHQFEKLAKTGVNEIRERNMGRHARFSSEAWDHRKKAFATLVATQCTVRDFKHNIFGQLSDKLVPAELFNLFWNFRG